MGAVDKTITSATDTAGTVGEAALSVSRAGRQPARDMMYMGLKGAAIALRGTSFVCGKCADGLDATAALARGAAGMAAFGDDPQVAETTADESSLRGISTEPVDINTASVDELQAIVNIDEARAEDIIRARGAEPFESLEQLGRISGIGAKRIAEIRSEGVAVVG